MHAQRMYQCPECMGTFPELKDAAECHNKTADPMWECDECTSEYDDEYSADACCEDEEDEDE